MNGLVRSTREALRWSKRELARRSRVHSQTISRIEEGQDSRRTTLTKVAAALGLPAAQLLGENGRSEDALVQEPTAKITSLAVEASTADEFLEELRLYFEATPLRSRRLTWAEWVRWCEAAIQHRRMWRP